MPLVFVHGVNVRNDSPSFSNAERARDRLFRNIAFRGQLPTADSMAISNPYWGDLGCTFPWHQGFIPIPGAERFGPQASSDELAMEVRAHTQAVSSRRLLDLAQTSLSVAVDVLWAAAALTETDTAEDLGTASLRTIQYAMQNPHPPWLASASSDSQFIDLLLNEVARPGTLAPTESFGSISALGAKLKKVALNLGNAAANVLIDPVAPSAKRFVLQRFSQFFGDVLVYVREHERPVGSRPIRDRVLGAIVEASKGRTASDPLIIVGHSMGGNICYDLLSTVAGVVTCDLFLTVGSQVGFFEELKLFEASRADIPGTGGKRVPKPANIKHWLNVYDPSDPFGYSTQSIFLDTWDYSFDTGAPPLSSHSAYLYKPSFHERLNVRFGELQWR